MGLAPEILFSSTVLVFWAIAFIPWFLREKQYLYFAGSWLLLFAVRLGLAWNPDEVIKQVVIAIEVMCIGTVGGVLMYIFDKESSNKTSEESDDLP